VIHLTWHTGACESAIDRGGKNHHYRQPYHEIRLL